MKEKEIEKTIYPGSIGRNKFRNVTYKNIEGDQRSSALRPNLCLSRSHAHSLHISPSSTGS
jgi:hypothetical protein